MYRLSRGDLLRLSAVCWGRMLLPAEASHREPGVQDPARPAGRWMVQTGCMGSIGSILFNHDASLLVVESARVLVFDVRRLRQVGEFEGSIGSIEGLGPGESTVLGLFRDGRPGLWRIPAGELLTGESSGQAGLSAARYQAATRSYLLLEAGGDLLRTRSLRENHADRKVVAAGVVDFTAAAGAPYLAVFRRLASTRYRIELLDLRTGGARWSQPADDPRATFLEGGRFTRFQRDGKLVTVRTATGEDEPDLNRRLPAHASCSDAAGRILIGLHANSDGILDGRVAIWKSPDWIPEPLTAWNSEDLFGEDGIVGSTGAIMATPDWRFPRVSFFSVPQMHPLGETPVTARRPTGIWCAADRALLRTRNPIHYDQRMHPWSLESGRPAACDWASTDEHDILHVFTPVEIFFGDSHGQAAGFDATGDLHWCDSFSGACQWEKMPGLPAGIVPKARRSGGSVRGFFEGRDRFVFQFTGGPTVRFGFLDRRHPEILSSDPNEILLGVLGERRTILWDTARGAVISLSAAEADRQPVRREEARIGAMVRHAVLLTEQRAVITVDQGGSILVHPLTNAPAHRLSGLQKPARSLIASSDGQHAAIFLTDRTTQIWKLNERVLITEIPANLSGIQDFAFGPEGLVVYLNDQGAISWNRIEGLRMRHLGTLWILGGDEWAFVGSDGSYDSSRDGYLHSLTWLTSSGASRRPGQERSRFRPGLLAEMVSG